jgi:outer membrane receptor protein involved in Fe transport
MTTLLLRALALCLCSFALFAQVNTGTINGSVVDPSGAAIPNAKVILKNQNTGTDQVLTAGPDGLFRVPFVQPGIYSVKAEAPGFRTYEQKNLEVLLGREVAVNIKMEVGATSESVVVEASAPIVEADTAQVTTTVAREKIMNFPRLGRGLDNIALLAPGVQPGLGFTNNNGTSLSVNGQRSRANNFLLEGQDNNDPTIGGPGLFQSNVEAISEFSITTNQFSAEYGRNAGAIVNIGLRSGANNFNGTGVWTHRNDQALGTLTNFQRRAGLTSAPKRIDNNVGGVVTGPVIKNKWFFMGYGYRFYRRQDNRSEASPANPTPTLNGLRQLATAFPNSPTIRALTELGPLGVKLGSVSTLPAAPATVTNAAGQPVQIEMGRIVRTFSQPGDNLELGTRQDFVISDKQRINMRYLYQEQVNGAASGNGLNGYLVDVPARTHNVGGTHTYTFTPTLTNEARFSFQRNGFFFEGGPSFPFAEIGKNIANFNIQDGTLGFGLATNLPQFRQVNRWQFQDNLSKQVGRHFLKMGLQISRDNINLGFLPTVNGQFVYPTFQAFVSNQPSLFNGASGEAIQKPKQTDQFYYFQDDWKIRRNLTLNLGLRYEYSGQPLNVLNDITVARESNPQTALWNQSLPLDARTVRRLNADKNNIQPRLGFAWNIENGWLKNTVVRGGWSVMNEPAFYNMLLNIQSAAPTVNLFTLTGNQIPVTNDYTGANLQRLAAPFVPRGRDPRQLNQTEFAGDFRLPRIQVWSIGIQRRIGSNQGYEIRYVGTAGDDQFMTINGNPNIANFVNNGWGRFVPPGITPQSNAACAACNGRQIGTNALLRTRNNAAFNRYHGLQTRYDGRLFRQLLIGSSYTWSKNIDNVSEVFESAGNGSVAIAQNPFDVTAGERGLSNIDLKHVWTMNFTWETPWFKNQKGFAGRLLGGWMVAGITSWYGGRPMQPLQLGTLPGTVNDGTFMGAFVGRGSSTRPFSINPNAPINTVGRVTGAGVVDFFAPGNVIPLNSVRWLYNDAAAAQLLGTPFGIGRNIMRGPRTFTQDLSLFKNVNFTERFRLQLRLEATNAFNNTNLLIPALNPENGRGAFMNSQETESTPRIVQIGVRFFF